MVCTKGNKRLEKYKASRPKNKREQKKIHQKRLRFIMYPKQPKMAPKTTANTDKAPATTPQAGNCWLPLVLATTVTLMCGSSPVPGAGGGGCEFGPDELASLQSTKSQKTYKHLSGHSPIHPAFKWLWNCSCQPKHKVFFWLLLKDRLSTRELLKRKNMVLQEYSCVLCNTSVDESLLHLFLHCPFSISCWAIINIQVDPNLGPFENLMSFRDQLHEPFFMEIIVLMCWVIWKARKDLIFRQINPNIHIAKQCFLDELQMLLLRAKRRYSPRINQWIANLQCAVAAQSFCLLRAVACSLPPLFDLFSLACIVLFNFLS